MSNNSLSIFDEEPSAGDQPTEPMTKTQVIHDVGARAGPGRLVRHPAATGIEPRNQPGNQSGNQSGRPARPSPDPGGQALHPGTVHPRPRARSSVGPTAPPPSSPRQPPRAAARQPSGPPASRPRPRPGPPAPPAPLPSLPLVRRRG